LNNPFIEARTASFDVAPSGTKLQKARGASRGNAVRGSHTRFPSACASGFEEWGFFWRLMQTRTIKTCASGLHGNWVERTFQRSINIWQELRAATRLTGRKERLRCGHRRSTLPLAEQLEPRAVLSGDGVGVAVTAGDVTFDSLGNGYMVGSFSGTADWARTVRGLGEDSVADVATGLDGSIVIVGEIESTTPPPTTPNGWYEHDGRDDDREQGFVANSTLTTCWNSTGSRRLNERCSRSGWPQRRMAVRHRLQWPACQQRPSPLTAGPARRPRAVVRQRRRASSQTQASADQGQVTRRLLGSPAGMHSCIFWW